MVEQHSWEDVSRKDRTSSDSFKIEMLGNFLGTVNLKTAVQSIFWKVFHIEMIGIEQAVVLL